MPRGVTKRVRRSFTDDEIEFLKEHWVNYGTMWCAGALRRASGTISTKVTELGLRRIGSVSIPSVSTVQHSTLYSTAQLDALDLIGGAYRDGPINFTTAVELRDLVRAKRIDEALDSLTSAKRRAA